MKVIQKYIIRTNSNHYIIDADKQGKALVKDKVSALKNLLMEYEVYLCTYKALSTTFLNVTALF